MSQQEEQPRPSLRLRKTTDRPPDTPPQAPPAEPPPAAPAAPAQTPPDTTSRLRLSSIITPGSAGPTPPAPPPAAPAPPAPQVAQATPPPAFEPAPASVPPNPVASPAPVPVQAAVPPPVVPSAPPPPVVAAGSEPPVVEPPRALQFPPPPGLKPQEEKKEPKPPSPRTIGLALGGVIVLVLGGLGYLLFLDPLGLFKDAEPPKAEAPAATTPAVTAPAQQPPAQPAAAAAPQAAAPQAADAEPGLIEETPEFTMPPPAPLAAGEEIAPGVVRLPPDADAVSVPEPRAYEPPAPKPNPAYTALVNNLNISGIRPNSSGGFLMVGTVLYRPGDVVDPQSRLEFVGIEGQVITFKDPAGAIYTRRF